MKSFKIIICILAAALCLSGCSEATRRLDEQEIIQGAAVDQQGHDILVTLQAFDLIKEGTGSDTLTGNLTYNIDGKGSDISSAVSDASKKTGHEIFLGQNKLLVLSRELTENNFEKNLDYLLRGINARADVLVALSESKASDILECTQNDALVPAQNIVDALQAAAGEGRCAAVSIKDLMNAYANRTDDVFLPVLSAGGSEDEKQCAVSGVAVFRGSTLQTVLGETESRGLMLLRQKLKSGNFSFDTDNYGRVSLELVRSSPKQTVTWQNGQLHVRFQVKCSFTVNEVEKGLVTSIGKDEIRALQEKTNDMIESMCLLACRLTYGKGCDVLHTGRRLSRTDAPAYQANLDNWPNVLQAAAYSVQANSEIVMLGSNAIRD